MSKTSKKMSSYIFQDFDGVNLRVPLDAKEYYKWCEYFFTYTSVGAAILKKARFAGSNIQKITDDVEEEKRAEVFLRDMKIRENLIHLAVNLSMYGLGVVKIFPKFKRLIECPTCHTTYTLSELFNYEEGSPLYEYNNNDGSISYCCTNSECKMHKKSQKFKINDISISKDINIAVWDPNRMECSYNEITTTKQWYYVASENMRKQMTNTNDLYSKHYLLCTTPKIFLPLLKDNTKRLALKDKNLFVIESNTLKINGVPIPPMVMAFNDLALRMKYMMANKQIASNMLVPFRAVFPVSKTAKNALPINTINLNTWQSAVKGEINKWVGDNDHIMIFPVEVAFRQNWGDGKLFLLKDEARSNLADIYASIDVPVEFMYGGALWSRQNVAAIVLDFAFKHYIDQTGGVLDTITEQYNKDKEGSNKVIFKMDAPKLVERLGELAYIQQAYANGDVGPFTYLNKLGIDPLKQVKEIQKFNDNKKNLYRMHGETMGEAQIGQQDTIFNYTLEQGRKRREEKVKDANLDLYLNRKNMLSQGEVQNELATKNLELQTKLLKVQREEQKKVLEDNAKVQLKYKGAIDDISLESMKKQMKLQSNEQYKQMLRQIKLQSKSMKEQQKTQEEMMSEQNAKQVQQQMEEVFNSLSQEDQLKIAQLPENERNQQLMEMINQQQQQQLISSLPEDEQQKISNMPPEEQQKALEELAQQNQQQLSLNETINNNEGLQKEIAKKNMEKDESSQKTIMQAKLYNEMDPAQREQYQTQMMQKAPEETAEILHLARRLAIIEGATRIMSSAPDQMDGEREIVLNKYPEYAQEINEEINRQKLYDVQATNIAVFLLQEYGNDKYKEMMHRLLTETPKEFRQKVFKNIVQMKNLSPDIISPKEDPELNKYINKTKLAKSIAQGMMSMDKKQRKELLDAYHYENPVLYKEITAMLGANNV